MSIKTIPDGYKNVIPYLVCSKPDETIEFCKKTFGAKETEISRDKSGRIRHATIHIGDSAVMLSGSNENFPPMPAMLYIYVEDNDATYKKGLEAGGISLREPTNEFYGDRSSALQDPSGNQWWIGTHIEDVSAEELLRRQNQNKK